MPTSVEPAPTENARDHYSERRLVVGYAVLTCAIFFPLLGAFVLLRSFYPVAAGTVMMAGGNLQRGRAYYILRGETMAGETIDIQAIELTNALYSRTWTMVNATVGNEFPLEHDYQNYCRPGASSITINSLLRHRVASKQ